MSMNGIGMAEAEKDSADMEDGGGKQAYGRQQMLWLTNKDPMLYHT